MEQTCVDGDAGFDDLLSLLECNVAPLCDSPEGSGKMNNRAQNFDRTASGPVDERSAPATLRDAALALMNV
jgi:hypothetical protein